MERSKLHQTENERARSAALEFKKAATLIAAGLVEKEHEYSENRLRYPYSSAFRHGLNRYAALCVQHACDPAAALDGMSESGFIKRRATQDVQTWLEDWDEPTRRAVSDDLGNLGPLVYEEDGVFATTSECDELLKHAETDLVAGFDERQLYEFLRRGTQEQYVVGRRLIIRHPLLSFDERIELQTGGFDCASDPLDQGEAACVDFAWMKELLEFAYEEAPLNTRICPCCGWTLAKNGRQMLCSSFECRTAVELADYEKLDRLAADAFRLKRGVMRYIARPGTLELEIAEAAHNLGLSFELWPEYDTCDVLIRMESGETVAVDAKCYGGAQSLARTIADDCLIDQLETDKVVYVVPDEAELQQPGFCGLCKKALDECGRYHARCLTFSRFVDDMTTRAERGRA